MTRVVAIVQARIGSSRLPRKVLAPIEELPLLQVLLRRVENAVRLTDVVVATTDRREDDLVADCAASVGISVFRGSELDVLDRYAQAMRAVEADVVVRLTGDNPFVDDEIVDFAVAAHLDAAPRPDYSSTALGSGFPYGISVEVVERLSLEAAWSEASEPSEREHVTPFLYRHPERFRLLALGSSTDLHDVRLTVDTPADLALARRVFGAAGLSVSWRDAAELARDHPEWRDG